MDIEKMLKALGEPVRYRIYACLLERVCCVRSLSRRFEITESAISQHLKLMKEAGLVYGQKFGYHTHYFPSKEAAELLARTFSGFLSMPQLSESKTGTCSCRCQKEEK